MQNLATSVVKVVLDTNVLVSFLLTKGPTISKILQNWKEDKFTLLVNTEIVAETEQVLTRFIARRLVSKKAAGALLRRVKTEAVKVATLSKVSTSPDKKDNRYLSCAKDGKADYLITGDKKHLLSLKKFGKTKIISPVEFLKTL